MKGFKPILVTHTCKLCLQCFPPGWSSRPFSLAYMAQATGSSAAMILMGSLVMSLLYHSMKGVI
jgi:hypothetical protein